MDYLLIGPANANIPTVLQGNGNRIGDPPSPDQHILGSFRAHSWDAAVGLFNEAKRHGIRHVLGLLPPQSSEWWVHTGSGSHLVKAAQRLGIGASAISRAEGETIVRAANARIGQLFHEYQKVRGPQRDNRPWTPVEQRKAEGMLRECETEINRAHAVALALVMMVDAAREAYGLDPVVRPFRIVSNSDEAITPEITALRTEVEQLKVREDQAGRNAIAAIELQERIRQENDALRADNAELLARNRSLADQVDQLKAAPAEPVVPEPPAQAVQPEPTPRPPVQRAATPPSPSKPHISGPRKA